VTDGDRTRFWPAIEARYGRPITDWLRLIAERSDQRYPEQVAFLREEHGFSQAHANAVVMYARGSTTSKRFTTLDASLADKDPVGAATVRRVLTGLLTRHPGTSLELAWNQPFLSSDGHHLFSIGVMKGHLLASPWSVEVLDGFRAQLEADGYRVNAKTFRLPLDWAIDETLLDAMVGAELTRCRS
jgi:uncharacterized protein YdhG (YjbR/CyaY superfamily)